MDSLPDSVIQYILSYLSNARDVAACTCVSKRWKDSIPFMKSLYFPRNSFDNHRSGPSPDDIVHNMISSMVKLEELIVYSPFSSSGLLSWLSLVGPSLRHLELRMDNVTEQQSCSEGPSKLDCIRCASKLESLKLWGVLMIHSPKWDDFPNLTNLEIVGARLVDKSLSNVFQACPNLTNLLLLGCEGVRSVSIELPHLENCKLDFYGPGNCSLSLSSPKLQNLEVQGCSWIKVRETICLSRLNIANTAGNPFLELFFLSFFIFYLLFF